MSTPCPCCGADQTDALLQTPDMPVNSCLLKWNAKDALNIPKRAMDLCACKACGFFWNVSFQDDLLTYDADYESTQMHSAVFRGYLRKLAQDWLDRLETAPRSILEVGCGQGEFLQALSEITDARLYGYDPAYRAGGDAFATILSEKLPKTPDKTFDLVISRMTLEHLVDPLAVLGTMAAWVTEGGTLITQVPNAEQTQSEGLVCELFYEHVNYFTPTALTRALEHAGFSDNHVDISYGNQHLTVFSKRTGARRSSTAPPMAGNALAASLSRFTRHWRETIEQHIALGREIWIWGTGSRATTFLALVPVSDALTGAIDINPLRDGSFILGTDCKTHLPDALSGKRDLSIIVMNPIYKDEIAKSLDAISAEAELLLVEQL